MSDTINCTVYFVLHEHVTFLSLLLLFAAFTGRRPEGATIEKTLRQNLLTYLGRLNCEFIDRTKRFTAALLRRRKTLFGTIKPTIYLSKKKQFLYSFPNPMHFSLIRTQSKHIPGFEINCSK